MVFSWLPIPRHGRRFRLRGRFSCLTTIPRLPLSTPSPAINAALKSPCTSSTRTCSCTPSPHPPPPPTLLPMHPLQSPPPHSFPVHTPDATNRCPSNSTMNTSFSIHNSKSMTLLQIPTSNSASAPLPTVRRVGCPFTNTRTTSLCTLCNRSNSPTLPMTRSLHSTTKHSCSNSTRPYCPTPPRDVPTPHLHFALVLASARDTETRHSRARRIVAICAFVSALCAESHSERGSALRCGHFRGDRCCALLAVARRVLFVRSAAVLLSRY